MKKRSRIFRKKQRIAKQNASELNNASVVEGWWLILIIIVLVILFYFSFGKINLLEKDKKKDRLKWIEDKLAFLNADIKNKNELKENLDKRVKTGFLIVRSIAAIFYVTINVIGYYCIPKNNFWDKLAALLNINQAILILMLTILYVIYETPKGFKQLFTLTHLRVQEIVYKSHKELIAELNNIEKEIEKLTNEKNEINSQLMTNQDIEIDSQPIVNESGEPPTENEN